MGIGIWQTTEGAAVADDPGVVNGMDIVVDLMHVFLHSSGPDRGLLEVTLYIL